ncbi:AEC family transporter [Agathobaculum sp.]|uniref:AEC family transporter n=1 Tax=Agathobaculum sp. TaxID=2048138 RepID=UPI002A83537A|nr:AEC family transporter [Agathobaculum sp.]MDY3619134.1 AEC family transporter [Agathobaculum sp.]
MQELYASLLALLLLLLLGAGMQRRLGLPDSFYEGANALVIRVTLPAMILAAMDKDFSPETARNSFNLIFIAAAAFAAVIAGLELWRRFSRQPARTLGLHQYLILVGNTAFMGYPVIRAVYGSDGVFYASVFNLVHNLVTFSYAVGLFVRGKKIEWRGLLSNTCLMATCVGIVLFLSPFRLPAAVHQALTWAGEITIPLCLLSLGARFARQPLRGLIRTPAVWWVSLVRLVLFPLILLPVLRLLGFGGMTLGIPCVMFATPVALTAATFAEQYGADSGFASNAVLLSNLLAVCTLPAVVLFL